MAVRQGFDVTTNQLIEDLADFLTTVNNVSHTITATGDGVVSGLAAVATAPTETWEIKCTVAGPSATFTVIGSVSGAQADLTSAVAYDNSIISLTVSDGTVAWAINDTITVEVIQNMGTTTAWTEIENASYVTSIIDSNGIVFSPVNTPASSVAGKYSDTIGIEINKLTTAYERTDITKTAAPDSIFSGSPADYTISFWCKEVVGGSHKIRTFDEAHGQVSFREPSFLDSTTQTRVMTDAAGMFLDGPESTNFTGMGLHMNMIGVMPGNSEEPATERYQCIAPWHRHAPIGDTWTLITVGVDTTNGRILIHQDGIPIGFQMAGPAIAYLPEFFRIGHPTAAGHIIFDELVVWDGLLTTTDIANLKAKASKVLLTDTLGTTGVYSKVTNSVSTARGGALMRNTASNNHDMIAEFSYSDDSLYLNSMFDYGISTIPKHVFDHDASGYQEIYTLRNTKSLTIPLRGPAENISRYWFIADNDRIILVIKLYDPSTSKKTPIYMTGYIGHLNYNGDPTTSVFISGMYDGVIDWTNASTNIRSGFKFSTNHEIYKGYDEWTIESVDSASTNNPNIYHLNNVYNIWDITMYNSVSGQVIGSYDGVYTLASNGITSEDIVQIAGEDYLVIQDGNQTDDNSMLAIKLV